MKPDHVTGAIGMDGVISTSMIGLRIGGIRASQIANVRSNNSLLPRDRSRGAFPPHMKRSDAAALFFRGGSCTIDYLLDRGVRQHQQFFGVEAERLAQRDDQRYRGLAASIFNVRDVAGPDADSRG